MDPFHVVISPTKQPKNPPPLPQTIFSISLSSSIQVINEMIRDAPPVHEQVASVYQH